jgi:hypothetical protein
VLDKNRNQFFIGALTQGTAVLLDDFETWPQRQKCEPSADRYIDYGDAPIGAVHGSEHMEILGQVQSLMKRPTEIIG